MHISTLLSNLLIGLIIIESTGAQLFRPGYEPQSIINSLLTPALYPVRSECVATADSRTGLCMPKAACLSSGGYVANTCNFVLSCCIYQGTCRSVITANETYFVSPQYPALHTERLDPPYCIFTLQRNSPFIKWPVCQVRLDFEEFSLAPPVMGSCGNGTTDSFIVSGASTFNQSGLPVDGVCGELTGQHMYLDVDSNNINDPLLLVINTANEQQYNRKWSIRIQQIPCQSPFRAPPGSLQYYTTPSGTIESFNYRGITKASPILPPGQFFQPIYPNVGIGGLQSSSQLPSPNYYNNMHYGITIAKQPKMCGIRWSADTMDFGGENVGTGFTETNSCIFVNIDEDRGDYITIPGSSRNGKTFLVNRFCGQRLTPEINSQGSTINEDVISYMKPFVLFVHSDPNPLLNPNTQPGAPLYSQKGFRLFYQQIPFGNKT
ncbi:uncharacterized protein LOC128963611 [Oppia nitens]|uniref:uncharacterized protein LOC128963611 n=1 Tax=Oppia nitens TaxID=1686743 RepID=UPI0023DA9EEA|nr:uncharacterized protein LOC128963611 [Oppia nitens]